MIAGISDGERISHPSQREWFCLMSDRVFNQFDADVIRRVKLGIKVKDIPAKRMNPKRTLASYRAAQRNRVLRGDPPTTWRGIKPDLRIDTVIPSKTYRPNGKRERERRQKRQLRAAA
jgi:hypothetical protein